MSPHHIWGRHQIYVILFVSLILVYDRSSTLNRIGQTHRRWIAPDYTSIASTIDTHTLHIHAALLVRKMRHFRRTSCRLKRASRWSGSAEQEWSMTWN